MSIKSPINIKKIKGVKKKIIRDFRGPLWKPEESGGGGGITGLRVSHDYAGTDWGLVYTGGLDIYDDTATNIAIPLTQVNYAEGNDFTDIVAGEYTGTSAYNQEPVCQDALVNTGNWSKTAGQETSYYLKFSEAKTLDYIDIWLRQVGSFPVVKFYDQDGNVITPTTAPTSYAEAISTGTPNAQTAQMRWIFNE